MICDKCHEREAHIKITRVINGTQDTMNLCEQCASKLPGFSMNRADLPKALFSFLTGSFSGGLMQPRSKESDEKAKAVICPSCGKSYADFLKDGLFGCSACYEAFDPMMQSSIKGIQGADVHTGRHPVKGDPQPVSEEYEPIPGAAGKKADPLEILRKGIEEALLFEDYEKAAKLRDEMRALEKTSEEPEGPDHG